MRKRLPFGTWKCPHCDFVAETRNKLKEHRTIVHPEICKMGWSKGLTKETDSRIKWGNTYSERVKNGQIKLAWKGKHHSEETKQKISEGQKLAHKEGRNTSWIGRRKLSYAEQSWFNIFISEFGTQTFINNYYVEGCHYWLDFAWPEKKIYFEVDGKTHLTKEGIEHDKIRTEILNANGWKLIGRCVWPEYQKLSFEDKTKFVQSIVNLIKENIK